MTKATYQKLGERKLVKFGDVIIGSVWFGTASGTWLWITEDCLVSGSRCKTRYEAVQRLIDVHKERFHIPEDATP